MPSRVAISAGKFRKENIAKALELIEGDFIDKIKNSKSVIIKPNLGFLAYPLANTKSEAVEAVLEKIRTFYKGAIIIAESSTFGETSDGFRDYGYEGLIKRFDVELVDLNSRDDWQEIEIFDGKGDKENKIRVSKLFIDADYIISVNPPKTHDSVIVTLGIKNVAVGAIHKDDRGKIHVGPKGINKSLAEISKYFAPNLTIIDGFEGMQGNGPVQGDKIEHRVCVAGCDPLATDVVMAKLMGYNPKDVGYFHYCAENGLGEDDLLKVTIVGERIQKHIKNYQNHPSYHRQLDWE